MLMLVTRLQRNQQVSGVEDCDSTTYTLITWRLGICRCSSRAWKNLPFLHRAIVSADCFTRNFKTFLFNAAFMP